MIKVQKKVDIPPKGPGGRKPKYPWATLEVGDSFFIEGFKGSVYSMLYSYNTNKAKKPIQITTRKEGDGTRVWRIK